MREVAAAAPECKLGFKGGADTRRYNHPQIAEPAVIFVGQDGAPPSNRDMVLWPRDPKLPAYRVNDMNEHVDPRARPSLLGAIACTAILHV